MSEKTVEVEVQREFVELESGETVERFYWILVTSKPVRRRCRSFDRFPSRGGALQDFQHFADELGWKTDIGEVPIP